MDSYNSNDSLIAVLHFKVSVIVTNKQANNNFMAFMSAKYCYRRRAAEVKKCVACAACSTATDHRILSPDIAASSSANSNLTCLSA